MEDKKNISIGVGLAHLVKSVKKAKVGEKIPLELIPGATHENVKWKRRTDGMMVNTAEDNTVTFAEPGSYQLVMVVETGSHPQHQSYDIYIE